jgi:hypothetical protein
LPVCRHARCETRRRTSGSNGVRVVRQCLDCGAQAGVIPKPQWLGKLSPGQLPAWDESLPRKHSEAVHQSYLRHRAQQDAEWWSWYEDYLRSPAWRALRAKVLRRDGYTCQGCGRPNSATQAHHLTYQRVGNEMLFDLVAVCEDCHAKIHAEEAGAGQGGAA